ncbi:unnamed protein product [Arctogadus glacialis]
MQLFMLVVLFTRFPGDSYQQAIHSIQDRVQALQGDGVTLSCSYTSADYFFWYLQYPSSPPQFLIKEYMEKSGFTLKKYDDRLLFALEISSVAVTDSALYYCAGRGIWRGEFTRNLVKRQRYRVTDSALYYCALRPTVTGISDSLYKNLLSTKHSSLFP